MEESSHIPQPRHSTPVKKSYGNSGYHSENSPAPHNSASTSGMMSMTDLESTTVEKQRKELQLLIGELKDRDRELNEMVAAHQQQLSAWERDRQRALLLERKNDKYEGELKKRQEQVRLLIQRLKVSESKHKSKDSALESTQSRIKLLERSMSSTSYEVDNLKEQNVTLNTSLTDMSTKVNTMETREQELMTLLRLKEKELLDISGHVSTLSSKLRCLDAELQDSKRCENRSRTEVLDERTRYKQTRNELDSMKAEMIEKTNEIMSYRKEVAHLRDEIHRLQKEIYLKDDELRRKDDLIELQKSKQDRADKELAALRMVYENQQKELTALHISLSDSHEMLEKQEERLNQISDIKLQKKSVSFLDTALYTSSTTTESDSVIDEIHDSENLDQLELEKGNGEEIKERRVIILGREKHKDGKVGSAVSNDNVSDQKSHSKTVKSAALKSLYPTSMVSSTKKIQTKMHVFSEGEDIYKGQNGLDLSDFEDCCSDATNDLLEEARRSATSNVIIPEIDDTEPKQRTYSHSSPTSKLQKLLAESREMVHNLERTALTPVPRPNSARATSSHTSY
ncbi:uncharacterized protein LOC120343301 isoform X1 [Styela clava]|uniref:coiled-coil domain-containing protein 62-like isoform X1 n=1 Tax=Styela clava TaxID=7725 RepID=UPI001939AEF7|nr:coiled-coil domain-containing protein 62-like isoform X1 [Styela clava]